MRITRKTLIGTALVLVIGATTWAQPAPGGGGRRGGFDPARMQEMILGRIQEVLAPSDEEWTAIKPLIQDVLTKRRETMSGMRGMMRGRNRRRQTQGQASNVSAEVTALQEALDNQDAPPEDIKAKLAAFRTGRDKKEQELQAARETLRAILTIRQEAQLVMMGMLD